MRCDRKVQKQKMDFVLRLFCQLLFRTSEMKSEAQLFFFLMNVKLNDHNLQYKTLWSASF